MYPPVFNNHCLHTAMSIWSCNHDGDAGCQIRCWSHHWVKRDPAGLEDLDRWSCLPHPGLSKSLGLIEGFGGRGKGGLSATLSPAEESDAKYLREKYGYNAYLSDRISLDRTIPDHRPSKWVNQWITVKFYSRCYFIKTIIIKNLIPRRHCKLL